MTKVIFRQKAIDDLNNIWNYTFEKWSENQADKYYNDIMRACGMIKDNFEIGKKYDHINTNLLGFKIGKHIVFYHIVSDEIVEVIRILHERMDLKNRIVE